MANLIFRGDALPVAQVVKLVPSTPEPGDTFTIKINGKEVSFVATDNTIANVVEGLVAAWNNADFPEANQITAIAFEDSLELKANTAGVPFRIETSTMDAGGYSVEVDTIQPGIPKTNEKQVISISSPIVSGGTFTLSFSGQTTAAIDYTATAAGVQTALGALSNIVAGDVIVTGNAGGPWTVEFDQNYSGINVPAIVGDGTNLTGAAQISISTITEGVGGTAEVQLIDYTGGRINPSENETLRIFDPISGSSRILSFGLNWDEGLWQSAFHNAMSFLGTGGLAWVDFVGESQVQVRFEGSWLGLNVPLMQANNFQPGISTLQEGSGTGIDEVQRVALLWGPNGGTWTLTYNWQTTAALNHNATSAEVQTALEALSTIGSGNVSVVQGSGGSATYDVTFINALGGTDLPKLTGDASGLTGGTVTVVTSQPSDPGQNEFQQITLSPAPEGGTFALTIDPGGGDQTTGAITFDASAAIVQAAIEALASFVAGDVEVTGEDGGPWVVEFTSNYASKNMNKFSGDASGLTGGGAQDLIATTTTRSQGPNHFDDPDNWTGESVPNSLDSLFFNGGKVHCLYGLKQRVTFTADAATDVITFDEPADFVEGQAVRLFTTDTLPAPLAIGTSYYIINLDYDAGTCQLALTPDGAAIDITDAGTGTHTIGLHLSSIKFHSRWTGYLGLTERNDADYYEYLPRSLSVIVDTITIGEGEGDGQSRLDLDTGDQPVTLVVHQSGGSNEAGLPAIRWKGTNSANVITIHDGEFGAAVYATEQATIDTLVQHAGLIQMGTVSIGSLTKHGGELIAENATLAGALKLHA